MALAAATAAATGSATGRRYRLARSLDSCCCGKSESNAEAAALRRAAERKLLAHRPPAGAVVLSESEPLAYYVDDFVSEDEIAHLVEQAAPQLTRARVAEIGASGDTDPRPKTEDGFFRACCRPGTAVRSSRGHGAEDSARTNSVAWLGEREQSPLLDALEDRLCDLVGGAAPECTEPFQVIRYERDQEYQNHYDGFDQRAEAGVRAAAHGGNRLLTLLLYLSDVDEGGGTSFPRLGLSVAPRKGRVLVFSNVQPVEAPGFYPDGPHQAYVRTSPALSAPCSLAQTLSSRFCRRRFTMLSTRGSR